MDNKLIGEISNGYGFYERGNFRRHNPWKNGSLNAPFDQEVRQYGIYK